MGEDATLLQRLAGQGDLTASERKLAAFCEENFPRLAFGNLEQISEATGVSKATVTRFVRRLGYGNFHAFMRSLREEVAQNFDSPRERIPEDEAGLPRAAEHCLNRHLEAGLASLQRTAAEQPLAELDAVMDLLSDESRPLYLLSVASGQGLFQYFHVLLLYLRGNVHLLTGDTSTIAHRIADSDPSSVLMGQAFERHTTIVLAMLRHFHQLGNETILLTNRRSTPLLQYARRKLFVHTESNTFFKSRSSVLLLLETLLSGVAARRQGHIKARYDRIDAVNKELHLHLAPDA